MQTVSASADAGPPTTPQPPAVILPARGDAIRVVPLHAPNNVTAPASAPYLTYRNGPLLGAVQVFTVFWGLAWQQAANHDVSIKLNHFFSSILAGSLIDQLTEYSVPAYPIGHGALLGTSSVTQPRPWPSVTDSGVQHMLQQQITTNPDFPRPSANTLYFVYLPPQVKVIQGGGASCQTFCGYHSAINGQIFYAVMPFPSCTGCLGSLAPFDALTSTSSHELCEAFTDPIPG